jgi:hypothetical protein
MVQAGDSGSEPWLRWRRLCRTFHRDHLVQTVNYGFADAALLWPGGPPASHGASRHRLAAWSGALYNPARMLERDADRAQDGNTGLGSWSFVPLSRNLSNQTMQHDAPGIPWKHD